MDARQTEAPMTAIEAYAALDRIRIEIAPKARVTIHIAASAYRDEKPVYAAICAKEFSADGPDFACYGEDLGDIIAELRAGWEAFQVEHARRMTAGIALEIIRITDEKGCCTDAALRGSKFSVGDVLRFGPSACIKANEMAGRGPFQIVSIAGANGEAA